MQTKKLRLIIELDITVIGENLNFDNKVYVKSYSDILKSRINSKATSSGFTTELTAIENTVIDLDEIHGD